MWLVALPKTPDPPPQVMSDAVARVISSCRVATVSSDSRSCMQTVPLDSKVMVAKHMAACRTACCREGLPARCRHCKGMGAAESIQCSTIQGFVAAVRQHTRSSVKASRCPAGELYVAATAHMTGMCLSTSIYTNNLHAHTHSCLPAKYK